MKVPDPRPVRPRLYTIPPSAPFLTTLARAVLNGDLPVAGGAKPEPLSLPQTTIYLPTRRAVRALRDAFLDASDGKALLLPRFRALGDPDEDAAIIFGAEGETEGAFTELASSAPAIDPLSRRLALMRLVLAWQRTLKGRGHVDIEFAPVSAPAQASYLAADLARLMDLVETEEKELAALLDGAPAEHASHWELTAEFLKIVTEQWPAYLKDQGLISSAARRRVLMGFEAERLRTHPPDGPVIAAGSTGTVPATARLLKVIASLPNGAVVLPGLDQDLDEESWKSLADHPEHPQTGMAALLSELGAERGEVALVAGSEPSNAQGARLALSSQVLRPAEATDGWQDFLREHSGELESALDGLTLLEAPTAHDEAEAIALVLRSVSETPGRTAALVTPDRTLARRVAARLRSFELVIDDSAGVPVARTVPGAFLDLVLGAAESEFAPPELMALLKHPLALLGRRPGEVRAQALALERAAFRDVYVGRGFAGIEEALAAAAQTEKRRRGRPIGEEQLRQAKSLVTDLKAAFAPLAGLYAGALEHSATRLAEAHSATAEALARDHLGSPSGLWLGDAGEALSVLFAELMTAGEGLQLTAQAYAPFYRSLLAGRVARPRAPLHPRLFIWGPLEARLQQPDIVVMGGLNEGVWPRPQEASPWLSRKMAETIGLPQPERRIGLSAHDFAQGLGASTVFLTRAIKAEGVPTVPSRWLQRLRTLTDAAGLTDRMSGKEPWILWARDRDKAPDAPREKVVPKPCPPVDARPRSLSVSAIERMIANPYEIYARHILKLVPLAPLGTDIDHALRGTIVHAALHKFSDAYPGKLPSDAADKLIALASAHFAALGGSPKVEAFWRPAFERFAHWFVATEPERRALGGTIHTEVDGVLRIDEANFKLTARADRIDVTPGGAAIIYDYKTGTPPTKPRVEALHAPQLPLEAAMAQAGAFSGLGKPSVEDLRYIHATGRHEGGSEDAAADSAPGDLAERALGSLIRLIQRYDLATTPYEAKRRPGPGFVYRYDDYEHLARVKEWLTQEGEEESS